MSNNQKVLFKKIHPCAIVPKKQREGDAAFDLYVSPAIIDGTLFQGRDMIETGVAVAIPEGYVGIIKGRSGLANDYGINVLGGVIDSNYRGEIKTIIHNTGRRDFSFKAGDRIAQLLVVPIHTTGWEEVDELPENLYRGDDGFGSSGK